MNVYVPEIFGKEKRKTEPSKEGLLGVEGVPADIIREAFEKAGIIGEKVADRELMTKLDFYELGLSGRPDSSRLRHLVCEKLSLPQKLTARYRSCSIRRLSFIYLKKIKTACKHS